MEHARRCTHPGHQYYGALCQVCAQILSGLVQAAHLASPVTLNQAQIGRRCGVRTEPDAKAPAQHSAKRALRPLRCGGAGVPARNQRRRHSPLLSAPNRACHSVSAVRTREPRHRCQGGTACYAPAQCRAGAEDPQCARSHATSGAHPLANRTTYATARGPCERADKAAHAHADVGPYSAPLRAPHAPLARIHAATSSPSSAVSSSLSIQRSCSLMSSMSSSHAPAIGMPRRTTSLPTYRSILPGAPPT